MASFGFTELCLGLGSSAMANTEVSSQTSLIPTQALRLTSPMPANSSDFVRSHILTQILDLSNNNIAR